MHCLFPSILSSKISSLIPFILGNPACIYLVFYRFAGLWDKNNRIEGVQDMEPCTRRPWFIYHQRKFCLYYSKSIRELAVCHCIGSFSMKLSAWVFTNASIQNGYKVSFYQSCYQSIMFELMLRIAPQSRDIPGLSTEFLPS